MGTNKRQTRRKFTDEFKADAVKVWRESNDTKQAVAAHLGIDSTALGNWIKQADIDEGNVRV
jgi:transposase-like protein